MASIIYDFRANDNLSIYQAEFRDKTTKALIPMDGIYTATIQFSIEGGATTTRAMTILTGADDGKAEYQFATGELTVGTMEVQVTITEIASGKIATSVNPVFKEIGPSL
jgi:hypothetical protein